MPHDETHDRLRASASRLAEAASATPGVDAWQTLTTRRDEAHVYLIGDDIEEARRTVVSEEAEVTLHNLHSPHAPTGDGGAPPMALGATTLAVLAEEMDDPARLGARLREGALMASLTDNQPYTLPGAPADGFPVVASEDIGLNASLVAAADHLGAQLRAAVRMAPGVRLGSAEIFATRAQRTLTNSQGLTANKRETTAYLDLALIAGESDTTAEFHIELRRRRLSDLHVERIIAAYGAYALHALHAEPPDTWEGPVIVSGEAAANLFNPLTSGSSPFVAHTSAELAWRKMSRLQVGAPVTPDEPRGDRLTLVSDALRPYGMRTTSFDRDGTPSRAVTLIADGVFRQPWADARYAQYLGVEATGEFGNLTVALGATPLDKLRGIEHGPLYEIVAFSWFNPDPVTGDFSAEIRLGYRRDASGVRPIKGGSLVGNLFTAFGDARFSAEPFTDGMYYGPAAFRFASLAISGG